MRVDFIHIDYHKTATTFLQSEVFSRVDSLISLNLLDIEMDQWFFNNFINVSSHTFNRDSFKNSFMTMVSERIQDNTNSHICAISEENLSGDIYTGLESRELMDRFHSTFRTTKILIVIRNQIDKDIFFKKNNIFIERIERVTGKKGVIAGSQKYRYRGHEYGGREIIYNKTP